MNRPNACWLRPRRRWSDVAAARRIVSHPDSRAGAQGPQPHGPGSAEPECGLLRSHLLGVEVRRLPRLALLGGALRAGFPLHHRSAREPLLSKPPPASVDRAWAALLVLDSVRRRQLRRSIPIRA